MGRVEKIEKYKKNMGWISNDNAIYLLSEVKRLRGAIEKHRDSILKIHGNTDHRVDKELYKALEDL